MATQTSSRAARAVKARVTPTLTRRDPLPAAGEVLRLQGLIAAYGRNLKQVKLDYQRTAIQKALRRTQAELRLARRHQRRQEAA